MVLQLPPVKSISKVLESPTHMDWMLARPPRYTLHSKKAQRAGSTKGKHFVQLAVTKQGARSTSSMGVNGGALLLRRHLKVGAATECQGARHRSNLSTHGWREGWAREGRLLRGSTAGCWGKGSKGGQGRRSQRGLATRGLGAGAVSQCDTACIEGDARRRAMGGVLAGKAKQGGRAGAGRSQARLCWAAADSAQP